MQSETLLAFLYDHVTNHVTKYGFFIILTLALSIYILVVRWVHTSLVSRL